MRACSVYWYTLCRQRTHARKKTTQADIALPLIPCSNHPRSHTANALWDFRGGRSRKQTTPLYVIPSTHAATQRTRFGNAEGERLESKRCSSKHLVQSTHAATPRARFGNFKGGTSRNYTTVAGSTTGGRWGRGEVSGVQRKTERVGRRRALR